ncbi:MAG: hypothetical protein ACTHN5_07810 [Phycisphaerae bacterium]
MIKRAPRVNKHPNRLSPNFSAGIPFVTWTAAINATKVRLTTSVDVVVTGLPNFTVQGVKPTAVTKVSAGVFDLTYASAVVATNVFVVDANDPAVRSAAGGFLTPGSVTF